MALEDDLFSIEEGFWLAGQDHFRAHLDARCLLAFPQAGQMHGVHAAEDVAASASQPGRWRDPTIGERHFLRLTDDVAIISYRADVTRWDGAPYAALIGSTYVRRSDGWKLGSHQHSPI